MQICMQNSFCKSCRILRFSQVSVIFPLARETLLLVELLTTNKVGSERISKNHPKFKNS